MRKLTYLLVIVIALLVFAYVFVARTLDIKRADRPPVDENYRHDVGRALVVYYSLSGNTEDVAQRIAAMTGADLFRIETERDYTRSPLLYYVTWRELRKADYPELRAPMPDFSQYDVIFIGSPVWWFTTPPPLLSFIKNNDFTDKRVVSFCTDGGNSGNFFERFAEELEGVSVEEGAEFKGVHKMSTDELDKKISTWLKAVE